MALSYSCHCHALLSAYELSARAAGATACMRVRVCHMVHWGLRDCPYTYLRVTVCAIHARVCACVHFSLAESHGVIHTWLRIPFACGRWRVRVHAVQTVSNRAC